MLRHIVALWVAAAATDPRAGEAAAHDEEIRIFATTVAVARTVRENCPGIEPNDYFLEALRLSLHVDEADRPAFATVARPASTSLQTALRQASSRQAWCDASFRMYGPEGTLMRGLLRR